MRFQGVGTFPQRLFMVQDGRSQMKITWCPLSSSSMAMAASSRRFTDAHVRDRTANTANREATTEQLRTRKKTKSDEEHILCVCFVFQWHLLHYQRLSSVRSIIVLIWVSVVTVVVCSCVLLHCPLATILSLSLIVILSLLFVLKESVHAQRVGHERTTACVSAPRDCPVSRGSHMQQDIDMYYIQARRFSCS